MQVKFSFFCTAANIANNGNLNALGIFSEILSNQFPFTYPRITYVIGIEGRKSEAGRHALKLSFIDDDGKEIIPPISGELTTTGEKPNSNIIMELANINFPHPGTYSLDFVVDNQLLRSEQVRVIKTE